MTNKTEERIAAEKEAVQKMVGAKGAMDTALQRIERLEGTIKLMAMMIDDVAGTVGEGTLMRTYYGENRTGGNAEVVATRSHLQSIAAKGRGVL